MKPTKKEFDQAFKEFVEAARKLNGTWTDFDGQKGDELTEKYPFELSFDEMELKIEEWYEANSKCPHETDLAYGKLFCESGEFFVEVTCFDCQKKGRVRLIEDIEFWD